MTHCPHCGADMSHLQHIVDVVIKDTAIVSCKACKHRVVIIPSPKPNYPEKTSFSGK